MRTIGLVTSARSDLGQYMPLMRAISREPRLRLSVIATGMHLSAQHGMTVRLIERAGFRVAARVPTLGTTDEPATVARAMGRGIEGFSRLFARRRPDLLLVIGDRFDMFPAAAAALPFNIPAAHIAGGDVTEGVIDDSLRHAMTKLCHLHFVYARPFAERLIRMGEEPWRVKAVGCLAIDNLLNTRPWSLEECARRFGLDAEQPFALVTFHPETLDRAGTPARTKALLDALRLSGLPCLFTHSNADPGGRFINRAIAAFCRRDRRHRVVINAGLDGYVSLMSHAAVMVGNSSSGLVEAPSFRLPVVNIGERQRGRLAPRNVVSCGGGRTQILAAIKTATAPAFRRSLKGLVNPYGDGRAARRITEHLTRVPLGAKLIRKRFTDPERA